MLLYYAVPERFRRLWLLAASYIFYGLISVRFVPWLLGYTVLTFAGGILLSGRKGRAGSILRGVLLTLLFTILLSFKYLPEMPHSLVMPAGLSFFTFGAAGYLIDVKKGRVPERDFLSLALFLSFFPQLLSGPIARSHTLLPQLEKPARFSREDVSDGLFLMLSGYFLKRVVADRAVLFTSPVFDSWQNQGGLVLAAAAALYALQVYCDFYGYSLMALGGARVLGIRLQDNFSAPFLSKSIGEFWRRWHNSLTGWFRDYVYIPLGGNRKGRLRKYVNTLAVFLISGMWHGNTVNFEVWGLLNGAFIIFSDLTKGFRTKVRGALAHDPESLSHHLLQSFFVFVQFSFTMVFFRMASFREAVSMLFHMVRVPGVRSFQQSIFFQEGEIIPNAADLRVLLVSLFALFLSDLFKYRGISLTGILKKQEPWFRDAVLIGGTLLVLFLGIWGESYSSSSFVYVHF